MNMISRFNYNTGVHIVMLLHLVNGGTTKQTYTTAICILRKGPEV